MSIPVANDVGTALRRLLDDAGHTDLWCGARAIADEPIHPGEQALYVGVASSVRRATSTGRALARDLLRNMGVVPGPMLRRSDGQCAWPMGMVGSIAHDDDVAVCVLSGGGVNVAFGVDVEPALPLPEEIVADVACHRRERAFVDGDPVAARLLFCAKEAVFKACFPVDEQFLEHADVELLAASPTRLTMQTSTGWLLHVAVTRAPRLLACARLQGRAP
jgi:4'-phosphopantetheinyl transferase EntD